MPQFPPLPLFDWYGFVIRAIRPYGINFLDDGRKMPDDPARQARAHFVPLEHHSLVLGRRAREHEEGIEVFFEIRDSKGEVVVAIIHTIETGIRIWRYTASTPAFIGLVKEAETTSPITSLDWVNRVMRALNAMMDTEPPA